MDLDEESAGAKIELSPGDSQAEDRFRGVDERLLGAVADGDEAAFAQLYDRLAPLVFGMARRVIHDPDMAAEITQDAFCDIWRLSPRYDSGAASARAWMLTIAHRRAVDRVRSEQANRNREEKIGRRFVDGPVDMENEVVGHLQLGSSRARVRAALAELSEVQRQSIELAYFQGFTYPEVAAYLDVPLGTIKTRIRDGLIRLRTALGSMHD